MEDVAFKNPSELAARLSLDSGRPALLVDSPDQLVELLRVDRSREAPLLSVDSRALRSVKDTFGTILVWREDRVGSRSLFETLLRRLEPEGVVWVVVAKRKVMGPATPAIHRLELSDLQKAFFKDGLDFDREVSVTAWHVAYRFVRRAK